MLNSYLFDLFKIKTRSLKEYREKNETLTVATGFFRYALREAVREGVALGINDAFGDKK